MSITVTILYKGKQENALKFAKEMMESGTVEKIRKEEGNLRYEYFCSLEDPQAVLLIDSWKDQEAIDRHHASEMMQTIGKLREKYDLHMDVKRYTEAENEEKDERFIRK